MSEQTQTTCYRHPDRPAGVRCQRCERTICPACMNTAAVGFHCPECVKKGSQKVYTSASLWGARPIVTQVLIAVNAVVFVLSVAMGDQVGRGRVRSDGLIIDGGLFGPFVADGEWWRLLTSGFLHSGILHIGFNMYALWLLGQGLERSVGRVRFGLVYVVSLLCGSLGVMLAEPNAITVGASGAVYGLFGFALAGQLSNKVDVMASGLGTIILLNLVFTFAIPGISIGGHLGGLAGGFVCGLASFQLPRQIRGLPKGAVEALLFAIGALAFVASLAVA